MVGITCAGVTKVLGDVKAVDRLELHIEPGELFFLLGPSGCGKTTVLRLIAGFYQPDAGRILLDGHDVSRVPPHQRNTGMVFQNYALWPHLSVWKNVEYGLTMRKVGDAEKQQRVARALDLVQMRAYADRLPNQLSGGQQQRVALARALVIEPDVVLLDEPLSNLDARLRLDMREQIKRIHRSIRRTMIYVTHDQIEALSMADRMAVMHRGRVVQVGSPRELYARPQSAFVAAFIGETNLIAGQVLAVEDPLVVQTPMGVIRAASGTERISRGDAVCCSIRPESLRLARDLPNASEQKRNCLSGVVQSLMYLGSHEQYLVRLGDGTLVKAVDYNPIAQKAAAGESIHLVCTPQDVVVLPQEENHDDVATPL
jgi:iron(III) transport system ATP-binding protein